MAEKRIEIEAVQIDCASGEQFEDSFRAVNPDCVVPALELDNGTCISEVVAICHYLEDKYPEPALMGTTGEEKANILMWNSKIEQQGLSAVADAFRNSAKGLKGRALTGLIAYPQIPELAARGRGRLEEFYHRLDRQLAENSYVAANNYSMADISAMVAVDFSAWIKVPLPEELANVHRWYESVSSRPSAAA
jgi:glutathione S-transferase